MYYTTVCVVVAVAAAVSKFVNADLQPLTIIDPATSQYCRPFSELKCFEPATNGCWTRQHFNTIRALFYGRIVIDNRRLRRHYLDAADDNSITCNKYELLGYDRRSSDSRGDDDGDNTKNRWAEIKRTSAAILVFGDVVFVVDRVFARVDMYSQYETGQLVPQPMDRTDIEWLCDSLEHNLNRDRLLASLSSYDNRLLLFKKSYYSIDELNQKLCVEKNPSLPTTTSPRPQETVALALVAKDYDDDDDDFNGYEEDRHTNNSNSGGGGASNNNKSNDSASDTAQPPADDYAAVVLSAPVDDNDNNSYRTPAVFSTPKPVEQDSLSCNISLTDIKIGVAMSAVVLIVGGLVWCAKMTLAKKEQWYDWCARRRSDRYRAHSPYFMTPVQRPKYPVQYDPLQPADMYNILETTTTTPREYTPSPPPHTFRRATGQSPAIRTSFNSVMDYARKNAHQLYELSGKHKFRFGDEFVVACRNFKVWVNQPNNIANPVNGSRLLEECADSLKKIPERQRGTRDAKKQALQLISIIREDMGYVCDIVNPDVMQYIDRNNMMMMTTTTTPTLPDSHITVPTPPTPPPPPPPPPPPSRSMSTFFSDSSFNQSGVNSRQEQSTAYVAQQ
ncbi:hypothetical protein M8J76_011283 [Diaphorina citri]|nr:hypothetical protein M8J76_011283 [Diaphorina citri]